MLNRLKGILYDLIGLLAIIGFRKPQPLKLLIIRIDEIGDYMLWRKFLHEIVDSARFKNYEIHFCGNNNWKNIYECFDKHKVTGTHWLSKIPFKKSLRYRYKFLHAIYLQGYEMVINPTFSRDKRNDDAIVKAAKAVKNIVMESNLESIRNYEKGYDKNLYSELFNNSERPLFELFRNKYFTEFITQEISKVTNTNIDTSLLPSTACELPAPFFVVFPGSRSSFRIWSASHFAAVSHYLFLEFGWTPVICGSNQDAPYAKAFSKNYKYPCVNLTGKTTLTEMMNILSKAKCLLSVDTGSVHLAAAVGCTVLGIYNGSQYGRFSPYPQSVAKNVYSFYPDLVEKDINDPNTILSKYEFVVSLPYDLVKPEKLINAIHTIFKNESHGN